VIELVAITDDATPPQPPLRAVRRSGLSVLYAPAPAGEDPTPEMLWAREAMLEDLMAQRDLLPVRFGTVVADEDAAARAIEERHDELAAGLDRVRGAVELSVRVYVREEPDEPVPSSGREYLHAKAGGARRADLVHEPLAAIARESVIRSGPELLRAAYLVDRDAVTAFVERVQALQRSQPELALVCTGPWPAFSFSEGSS
jgi:hypothetical protein